MMVEQRISGDELEEMEAPQEAGFPDPAPEETIGGIAPEASPPPLEGQGPEPHPFDEFGHEWRQDFEGLAYLGHLETEFELASHTIVIHTLNSGEKLEVLRIAKDFEGSIGWARAYRTAVAAAAILSVDGRPIVVARKDRGTIRQKYEYIVNTWHDVVIDLIHQKVDELEGRVLGVMREMGLIDGPEPSVQVKPESEGSS